ncbi:MAG: NINE protein [Planctomycetes bacterium]|nr:NINE protein [Planctomycetota bacterium]MCW8134262.1 NINE protein [Planctomycetota bacterium]
MAGGPPGGSYNQQQYPPQGDYPPQPQHGYAQPGHAPQPAHYPPPGQYQQPTYNPNAPYGVDPRSGLPYSDKQKIVAGLLQLFLGGFGAGRFYTGHTSTAVWQIVVTWLTCGLGGIWPLIDGIMILTNDQETDSNGLPLRPN